MSTLCPNIIEAQGLERITGYRARVTQSPLQALGKSWTFERLTYRDACDYAARKVLATNAWVISRETLRALYQCSNTIALPIVTLPNASVRAATPRRAGESISQYESRLLLDMNSPTWYEAHDEVTAQNSRLFADSPGDPIVLNVGKHWIRHAPKGRSHLMGWRRLDGSFLQEPSPYGAPGAHNDLHVDYSSTTMLEQVERTTIARGRVNNQVHVRDWQALIGATVDGVFGPATEAATRRVQADANLTPDGIVGAYTWAEKGEHWFARSAVAPAYRPEVAPAVTQAMRDADKAWPRRDRASDGTLGDAAHQARPSDHNLGLAFDITHDPSNGCDAGTIANLALADPRTAYVIWNRRIANPSIQAGAWRKYEGANPHTLHVHVSIKPAARLDVTPWAWASPRDNHG